mmetsp:Transcript_52271/g.132051  ORF Transcript_52271/g.132051 Transcript_52271/m.132051 type:complete len:313 (+) Transcript_52271:92-1030(+)
MFGFDGGGLAPPGSPDPDWDDFPGSPGGSRRPAVRGRITGRIVEWKNKFGWIESDQPIDHPEARRKGGKIYLSQEDVAEVISGVGAHVSFYVYADGTGLGAMHCVPSDSAAAKAPLQKKAKSTPKPKPKPKATPGRKRVSESLMYGKVKSWRGGFGFITPNDPVEHPLFTGSLFLHKGDIADPDQVDAGKTVSFYLYADPQGLGAEECSVVDGDGATDGGAPVQTDTSSVELHESSTLLRAKPKAAAGSPTASSDGALATFTAPRPKAMMKATAKAKATSAAGRPDSNLAKQMAENPELAKRLSAWMFDPGG